MTTTATHKLTPSEADRFWAKTRPEGECIVWTAATNSDGYGQFRLRGRTEYAHRVAYADANGPIPSGMTLDHLCRRSECVRPDHLEAVTLGDNNRRKATATKVDHLARTKSRPEWADAKRREIYDIVAENPGIGVRDTYRAIRGNSCQLHALIGELIDRAALVEFVADHGTAKELYATGSDDILDVLHAEDVAAEAARDVSGIEVERAAKTVNDELIRDHLDTIVSYVRRNPGAGVEEMKKALKGLYHARTGRLLADLRAHGNIIRAEKHGNKLAHYFVPSPALDIPKRSKAAIFTRDDEADAA